MEHLPDDLLVTFITASHLVSGVHKAWPFARTGRHTCWPTSSIADTADLLISLWSQRIFHSIVNGSGLIYKAIPAQFEHTSGLCTSDILSALQREISTSSHL